MNHIDVKKLLILLVIPFFLTLLIVSLTFVRRSEASVPLNVVYLGDSVTFTNIYPSKYSNYIRQDLSLSNNTLNRGQSGYQTADLLNRLSNDPYYRDAVSVSNIVVLQIGLNDFFMNRGSYLEGNCGGVDNQDCLRSMVANFNANWDSILNEILNLVDETKVAIRPMDIYYSTAGVDQLPDPPYNNSFEVLNSYLTQMNDHIHSSSATLGLPVAQVHLAYNGSSGAENPMDKGYILADAVHPTDLGHTVIANKLRELGYLPLKKPCPDVDGNGTVNSADLGLIAARFGQEVNSTNQIYDINGDGTINSSDLGLTASQFGKLCF